MPNRQHETSLEEGLSAKTKLIPLILGPVLALCLYFILPTSYVGTTGEIVEFSNAARACTAMVLWMGIWWFTEPVPIAVTALLPIVMYPLLGVASAGDTLKNYANGTIFLFLGGFLIAGGIARWGLDRRIALVMIRIVGTKPKQIILGIMLATTALSAWVSNTATAAMMLPIALALMGVVRSRRPSDRPGRAQLRHLHAAVGGLRRKRRRRAHADRHAPQRHLRALCRAAVRRRGELL